MEKIFETIDSKIQSLEQELKRIKNLREITIEDAKNNELYKEKYFYRYDRSQKKGVMDIYYHVIYAENIINENQLKFSGDSIIKTDSDSLEYSFSTGNLVLPVTDVNEISKEEYEKILNESLDYISRKFKN